MHSKAAPYFAGCSCESKERGKAEACSCAEHQMQPYLPMLESGHFLALLVCTSSSKQSSSIFKSTPPPFAYWHQLYQLSFFT